jgi:hypothetical protein
LLPSVLEAAALAEVAERGAGQGDGEDCCVGYGDSCDATFIEKAAVSRGIAGAADFDP